MKAEELILDNSREWQVIEELVEVFPNIWASIFAATFIIKTIILTDFSALMVPPQDGDPVLVANLEGDKESHGLNRVVTYIEDEVPLST